MPEALERSGSFSSLESFEDAQFEQDDIDFPDYECTDLELPDPLDFPQYDYKKEYLDIIRYKNRNIYEGKTDKNDLKSGPGTLFDESREQYVQGTWFYDKLIQLKEARFKLCDNKYVYIYAWNHLIVIDEHNFIAKMTMENLELECESFLMAKQNLYASIVIEELWHDDLTRKLRPEREKFEAFLEDRVAASTLNRTAKQDMFHIFLLQNEVSLLDDAQANVYLLQKFYNYSQVSSEMKSKIIVVLKLESAYCNRNKQLPILRIREFSWKIVFKNVVHNVLLSLNEVLRSKIPSMQFAPTAARDIKKMSPNQIFQVKVEDIQLFSDLEFTIRQYSYATEAMNNTFLDFFSGYVASLWRILIKNLQTKSAYDTENSLILTNPVFLQLFKSFAELLKVVLIETELDISQVISQNIKANLKVLVKSDKYKDSAATIHKLKFIVKAMEHFKPGDLSAKRFSYDFKEFQIAEKKNWFMKKLSTIKKYIDSTFCLLTMEDDYLIWLYYVHDCFDYMLNKEHLFEGNCQDLIFYVNSLLNMFKSIVKNGTIAFARLRILSESIVKFVRKLCQNFKENPLDSETEIELLMQQSQYLSQFDANVENYSDLIASIINAYQAYWEQRIQLKKELFDTYAIEPMLSVIKTVILKTTTFLETALNMNIYCEKFVVFLRSFNEFINYFRSTKFPWYVKKSNSLFINVINADKQSYVVADVKNFIEESTANSNTKHYMFQIVISLVECAERFLKSNQWSIDNKMQAMSDLMLAMSRSFKNYSGQPNYEDYEIYFIESTEPFARVTENSTTVADFRKHVEILENFYAYTKNTNMIHLDKALELCHENSLGITQSLNYQFDPVILCPIYKTYETQFNTYIEQHISQSKTLADIVAEIKQQITATKINEWNDTYKTTTIPNILAGLSAVWSLLTSRDVIGQKNIIKPHSIQILCILRLLGVDQSDPSFENHLAQVLTGQGKSIVLALLASILALTSNKVRIVCYNNYLANRDQSDFQAFFKLFGVADKIKYGTFDNMADEVLTPEINNKTYEIRKCVRELVMGTLAYSSENASYVAKYSDTILIIDEVDVFFSSSFYGNNYNPCETIENKTITNIQLKIWNMALNNATNEIIKANICDYMETISRKGDDVDFSKIYTRSRSVLNEKVDNMIEVAIRVKNGTANDNFIKVFKLDSKGDLVYIKENGEYSKTTFWTYYNVFNYLRLKKLDGSTAPADFTGYLQISSGSISYAMLPNEYKKILGVTGTLTTLSTTEIAAVNSYHITRGSNMPSFFGRSKFINEGFKMLSTEDSWQKEILDSIMQKVKDDRAVLVFFDNEYQIASVQSNFEGHLQCVSVLTGNEEKKKMENCIDNAGVAHYVTLATKRMGRGVDFKSNDSHVERQGGVHVIQTFFSADIKEEIQIKGRTARKDNQGSYEMIVCHAHVINYGFECESNASYSTLNTMRQSKALANEKQLAKKIEGSRKKHDLTMDLLKSLSNYDPAFRNQYFTRYPFVEIDA